MSAAADDARRHFERGLARLQAGDAAGAAAAFKKTLEIDPDHPDALFGSGLCLEAGGKLLEAESAYRHAAMARIDFPQALTNLASLMTRTNRPAEAVQTLDRVLARRPDFEAARFNRGLAYFALRRLAEAEADFRHILGRQPGQADALNELGRVLLKQARAHEAAELFREGERRHPEDPRFPANLASAFDRLNDLAGAEAAIERARFLAPGDPSLIYLQASLEHRLGRLESARDRLEEMLAKELSDEHRGEALCELGEVLDKLGDSAAAFGAIVEGNALRALSPAARRTDGSRFLARVAAARAGFTKERIQALAAKAPAGDAPPPVFFVGFPRSGTTLMERALKAHPDAVTTDERSPLTPILTELSKNRAYPESLDRLSGEDVARLQGRFWAEAEAVHGPLAGRRLVDKMPLNLVNLGLARGLFPEAPVLVVLRDPRDACLSCFMQRFQFSDAMANFLDLERTAETYGAVMGLWLHYREALGQTWLEYRYEDLVEDIEGTLRTVLDFMGLPWHEDVLAFQERVKDQEISTPSYRQVTRAVDARAAGRWRRYRDQLAPVLPLLEPFVEAFGYSED